MRVRAAAFALGCASSSIAAEGEAARPSVRLEVQERADCTAGASLEKLVSARLGRSPFVQGGADLVVRLEYSRDAERYLARIQLYAPRSRPLGVRELRTAGPRCAELEESLALVVALLVDVPRSTVLDEPEQSGPMPTRTLYLPPEDGGEERGPALTFSFGGVASAGLVPFPGLGVEGLALVHGPGRTAFGVSLAWWAARREERPGAGAGTEIRALSVATDLCPWRLDSGDHFLHPCASVRVTRLGYAGFGFDSNRSGDSLVLGMGVGVLGFLRLSGPVGLTASLAAEGAVLRDRFGHQSGAGDFEPLFRPAPVSVLASLGIGLSFPER
ncbi:MAG: hypothetical protein KF718_33780 [Polyangiaceae bacterium]|nr:hypothetical protein [Polyangiaceae bacterium]